MVLSISNTNNFSQNLCSFKVFPYNTNNLHTVVWFQLFLSSTNNLRTVAWFQVFLSNTSNLHTIIWLVFLSNVCYYMALKKFFFNIHLFAHWFWFYVTNKSNILYTITASITILDKKIICSYFGIRYFYLIIITYKEMHLTRPNTQSS